MAPTASKSIVDSHVHLFPAEELESFAWYTPEHPLASAHALPEYTAATASSSTLKGYVFIEVDRKNDIAADPPSYDGPLAEFAFLRRHVFESPPEGTSSKCLGIIPWAPIPLGAEGLEKYLEQAEKAAGPEVWSKVKGFRYLVQDKPAGTMLDDKFVEGLKYLGKKGYVFDLGVDSHRRGKKHLDEAVEMLGRAHEGVPEEEKVSVIINHICKPDLSVLNPADPSFTAWRTAIYTLSCFSRTYLKLSGCFSEMPEALVKRDAKEIVECMLPWLGVCLVTFGANRMMFGSDWPVCTINKGEDAWAAWTAVVERMCWMGSLDDEGVERVFSGTATEAYKLEE